ncbi:uncharacterized protein ARMOST_02774 [Armillaria ostoyae]|uniref:Uncharacterized protein n=2 Tax=Armillaria TaxID=47424 RepID=A0A284QSL6_ARMOS|nr:hypothetical protein ARMSODRAFT_303931 [Armillaria solidipes]SJK99472.1 uncharacterized protein ARMOST_02774 [Armillaria ostoyae]
MTKSQDFVVKKPWLLDTTQTNIHMSGSCQAPSEICFTCHVVATYLARLEARQSTGPNTQSHPSTLIFFYYFNGDDRLISSTDRRPKRVPHGSLWLE